MRVVDEGLGSLAQLCAEQVEWLMERVLDYARRTGYARYTSTLAEAWRLSVVELNAALTATVEQCPTVREIHAEEDASADPGTQFGITEARRHRERGISLEMFLGLTKYYRRAYLDLVEEQGNAAHREDWAHCIEVFFDRFEIGFCADWAGEYDGAVNMALLQRANRHMTNEKNRYLTIFESLREPVVVFDALERVSVANRAALEAIDDARPTGTIHYEDGARMPEFPWLLPAIERFTRTGADEGIDTVSDDERGRTYAVKLRRMVDVSGKFSGTVALLDDVTSAARPR